jgi:addiction module HigA family antidote
MAKRLQPVHPGEILSEDFLKPFKLSMNQLALDLHVPVTRIAELVHRRRAVTPDTALRLARYFDTTPAFWLNLQSKFDLDVAEDAILPRVRREVRPRDAKARSLTPSHVDASFPRSLLSRKRAR